ncbi:hypothetical protein BJY00DRAFT_306740 [Aspergillus carlsbadensis]|nr:hypothetical protein BJY00DRAFT_306740 [Aspergillus carlsbadensis]
MRMNGTRAEFRSGRMHVRTICELESLDSYLERANVALDPWDHFYAFYNLLPPGLQNRIEVDYTTPREEVIRRGMQAIISPTIWEHGAGI